MRQLIGSAGLMFTARSSASIARGRILERDVAEAAFLMQQAEARLQLLQAVERRQGFVDAHQMAQADAAISSRSRFSGRCVEQRLGAAQGLGVAALLLQLPQPADFAVPSAEAVTAVASMELHERDRRTLPPAYRTLAESRLRSYSRSSAHDPWAAAALPT